MDDEVRDFVEEDYEEDEDIDWADDTVDEPEYLQECLDAFDIIDALFNLEEMTEEDSNLVGIIDIEIADANAVTEEQFKKLDEMKTKYKVG